MHRLRSIPAAAALVLHGHRYARHPCCGLRAALALRQQRHAVCRTPAIDRSRPAGRRGRLHPLPRTLRPAHLQTPAQHGRRPRSRGPRSVANRRHESNSPNGSGCFDEEARLWARLCRVARHSYVDYYRAQKRGSRHVPLDLLENASAAMPPPGKSAASAIPHSVLDKLTPEDHPNSCAPSTSTNSHWPSIAEYGGEQSYKAIESRLTRLRRRSQRRPPAHLQNEDAP